MKEKEEQNQNQDQDKYKDPDKDQNIDQGQNNSEDEAFKVTITKQAERAISELLPRINDGFEGGKVTRQDLMSWLLVRSASDFGDAEIRAIRADHFDEIALLELCLKRSRQTGNLPPELKRLLLAQAGLDDGVRKANKSKLTNRSINDGLTGEAA